MNHSDENMYKMFVRIKTSIEGADFIEYLKKSFNENTQYMLNATGEELLVSKGRGQMLNYLIKVFNECSDRLTKLEETDIDLPWI